MGQFHPAGESCGPGHALLAFRDDAQSATIGVNGRCGKDGDDVPLQALTHHLFLHFTDREVISQKTLTLDGRDAMRTEMLAELDGVPKRFTIYVLKKDGCVYDMLHIADRLWGRTSPIRQFRHRLSDTPMNPTEPVDPRPSIPPSGRMSFVPGPPPDAVSGLSKRILGFLDHLGVMTMMAIRTTRALFRRPFEGRAIITQIESLGVRSLGIVVVTSVFIGMVMAVQFAFGLRKFGGMEYTGRVVGLSLRPRARAYVDRGHRGREDWRRYGRRSRLHGRHRAD